MSKLSLYLKMLLNIVILVVGGVFLFYVLPKFIGFFLPFVIGFIIAMIANPLVKFMEKRVKIVRKHSSAIIIILVIAAVIGVGYAILSFTISQVVSLANDIPNIVQGLEMKLTLFSQRLSRLYNVMPDAAQNMIDRIIAGAQDYLTNYKPAGNEGYIGAASAFAKNLVEICFYTIITLMSAYFFIAERDNIAAAVRKVTPKGVLRGYYFIIDNFKVAFGGYFKAQFKIMFVLIAIMFLGFEIMDISYSFLLAFGIAVLDFLPFFGTGAVLWPWAVVELIGGNYPKTIFILVIYLICQIVKQVLQPKMVGDSIGISPFSTLIFMFIGYRLYSVIGLIVGIPVGMVIVKFYKLGVFDNLIKGLKMVVQDINEFRKF